MPSCLVISVVLSDSGAFAEDDGPRIGEARKSVEMLALKPADLAYVGKLWLVHVVHE